tara:strand:- start:321 stop:1622 length:1302 start_codon:yes stop_codon:yes gene_type:complete
MNGFESIQVKFKHTEHIPSPFANTREVPFVDSYLTVLKSIINDIQTEYFWFFANFINVDKMDLDFIPEQHERDQIHVWYTTHPMGGLNKEGNVMLIPTQKFKEQINSLVFLRDYKDINYHPHETLFQQPMTKTIFKLKDPYKTYGSEKRLYKWMVNIDLDTKIVPNFYPSFWEDVKLYTWGKTNDVMLVPQTDDLKQFYDIDRIVHYDLSYDIKPMDIIFISYDEPGAEKRFNELKKKYPRAKWVKNVLGQTLAYVTAAIESETDYFYAVFPKIDLVDSFDFSFQPDRLKNPCHYIFDCYNEVIDCTYGHDGVILYNKQLVMTTTKPGLDFTMSKPVTSIPILSAVNKLDETPLLAWRTAFREVIKLCQGKPTVESKFRLKKWCQLGKGKNADWVYKGAIDGKEFYEKNSDNYDKLMLSYNFEWVKQYYESKY